MTNTRNYLDAASLRRTAGLTELLTKYFTLPAHKHLSRPSVTSKNPLYHNSLTADFKFATPTRTLDSTRLSTRTNPPVIMQREHAYQNPTFRLFKTYLMLNVTVGSRLFAPHPSFYLFFIRNSKGGTSLINTSKFFTR